MEGDGLWLRREGFEDLLQAAASKICRTRSCLSPPPSSLPVSGIDEGEFSQVYPWVTREGGAVTYMRNRLWMRINPRVGDSSYAPAITQTHVHVHFSRSTGHRRRQPECSGAGRHQQTAANR